MTDHRVTLVLATFLAATHLGAADPPFSRDFRVHLVDDSVWMHCEVEISRWGVPRAEQSSECRGEDGKLRKAKRFLTLEEVQSLDGMLRGAALFEGQSWGQDRRGLDFSLVSITVDDGNRVATVIASFNPTFDSGPRKALMMSLMDRARESLTARSKK